MKALIFIIVGIVTLPLYGLGLIPLIFGIIMLINNRGSSPNSLEGVDTTDENVFRWKGLAVYPDQGIFTFKGQKHNISDVRNVAFEQTSRGYLGGGLGRFDIALNNMKTPLITIRGAAATASGLRQDYERLCIVLNCNQAIR